MRSTIFACLAVLVSTLLPARAEESVYTDLDLAACTVTETFEEGGGATYECEGLAGVPVFVAEGDLRFDVDFGATNESFDTFAAFNTLGAKVEWRMKDGAPFAAILRYKLEVSGDDGNPIPGHIPGEVLQVSKVGRGKTPGCPVAYVDALLNKDANAMARKAADTSVPGFACGTDAPRYVGKTGPLSGGASGTDPG